ncbi:MAG: hypothetical protein ABFS46_08620 [Myxococcota bacterium]
MEPRIEKLGSTEERLGVADSQTSDGVTLEVVPPAPGFHESDPAMGEQQSQRKAGKARSRAKIYDGA